MARASTEVVDRLRLNDMEAGSPTDEAHRLAELRALQLLDTDPEERFDRLVEIAAEMLGAPIALISLVDEQRQWFKARVGLQQTETPRHVAICAHAIAHDDGEPFVVQDTLLDPRFANNPLVSGDPLIRFYAGQVIHGPRGGALGTLCVIDRHPRQFAEIEHRMLKHLAG